MLDRTIDIEIGGDVPTSYSASKVYEDNDLYISDGGNVVIIELSVFGLRMIGGPSLRKRLPTMATGKEYLKFSYVILAERLGQDRDLLLLTKIISTHRDHSAKRSRELLQQQLQGLLGLDL